MTALESGNGELPFRHLTVIGAGLIGGSVAMAAREAFPGLAIHVMDSDEATLQYVVRHGIADDVSRTLPVRWEDHHLVVLATHLRVSGETLEKLAPTVQGMDVTVTDVGSCKRKISGIGQRVLPAQFIPGHPMAGREFSSIQSATSLLFAGKSWLFCPYPDSTETARFDRLKTFVAGLRAAPRELDAEHHDRYMAYVSHLPQLYSILLTNLIDRHEPGHMLTYHGGGIDDQLRLAASPYAMWGEVFAENADNLRVVMREMGGMFDEMDALLDASGLDAPGLERWFERSNRLHKDFQALRQSSSARPTNQVL